VLILGLSFQAVSDNAQNTIQTKTENTKIFKKLRIGIYPKPASAPPKAADKDTVRYPGEKRYPYPKPSGPPPIFLQKK